MFQSNISYELFLNQNLRTLSTNNANNVDNIEGFLYVPDLTSTDPCTNTSTQYIPQTATRLLDVQPLQYDVIALVPWISQECTLSYLAATSKDGAAAMITYVPNNQTGIPPPVSDPQWGLNDGGQWKSDSHFPVYAIPGASGIAVMQQLSIYSGNISTVPHSAQLLQQGADSTDFVRIYCNLQTSAKNNLPSLWAFLLIVLGVVLFLVACTSLAMHWYQRHARNQLRRRVAAGEVDLESLGIRRLTVPQEVIDKLPTFVYTSNEKEPPTTETPEAAQSPLRSSLPSYPPSESIEQPATAQVPLQSYTQPTCAICLDDFEPLATTVRELPCRHVYHPECIDQMLLRHSSLCPVCKAKVLPKGYCPQVVTNLMVRRERQLRRLGGHGPVVGSHSTDPGIMEQPESRGLAVRGRMASFHRQFGRHNLSFAGRRITSAPMTSSSTELANRRPPLPTVNSNAAAASGPPSQPAFDRQERARRRVSALLGHQRMVEDEEQERRQSLPKCKLFLLANLEGFIDYHRAQNYRNDISWVSINLRARIASLLARLAFIFI